MTEPEDQIGAMLGAVDPAADLNDEAIDELYPFERLEVRIEAGALTTQPRTARPRGRRALVLSGALATIVALAVSITLAVAPRASAPIQTTISVPGRAIPVGASPSKSLSRIFGVYGSIDSVKGRVEDLIRTIAPTTWCRIDSLRGSLYVTATSETIGWSGVVRFVNVGPTCAIAVTTAAVQAVTIGGHPVGAVTPSARALSGVVVLRHGQSASVSLAFLNVSLVRKSAGENACRPRSAQGFDLLGAPGWPSLRFELGRIFMVCTSAVTSFATGTLSGGAR